MSCPLRDRPGRRLPGRGPRGSALTTYQSRGLLPPEHPCAVAGPVHVPAVGAMWDEADVVVAIGNDRDGTKTQN